ncbi:MAG: AbrB/MazE/SpoVT family DNA-binding domain-containing protein [Verrucomicrobiaceae bacterium]
MTATIQKWGNSLVLPIPRAEAKQIHLQEGDRVFLRVRGASLTMKPLPKRLRLDDLLANVTPENFHPTTECGTDVGREVVS